jgi:uncharacterized protein
MIIKQLCIYPVKSMRGITVQEAELTVRGLKYDRRWMTAEEDGTFLTQRSFPRLATIEVNLVDDKLRLTDPSGDSILIPLKTSNLKEVRVDIWGDECRAFDEGDEASEWLTAKLHQPKNKPIRLVRFNDTFRRVVDQNYQGENAHTFFADGFPFLVTSTASLKALNDRLISSGAKPVEMNRFRPNIVIDGLEPFRENELDQLTGADNSYRLGIRKPCKRCKVTTVDQVSGEIEEPKEPLRTLTLMKTVPELNGAYFGQNATLLSGEGRLIRVKDELAAL